MLIRKNCFILTLDESICFLFSIAVLGLGISDLQVLGVEIYLILGVFVIFLCSSIGSVGLTLPVVTSFSIGVGVGVHNLIPIAELVILTAVSQIFKSPNKFKMIIITLVTDIVIRYYFIIQDISVFRESVPLIVASALFLMIPNKRLNDLTDMVYTKRSELSTRNVINMTRKNLKKRMFELSGVFQDMKLIHKNMVKRELSSNELEAMFYREIMQGCCKDCIDKNRCTKSLGVDNKSSINTLISVALTKGKLTLLDIPQGLANRCNKVNQLITLVNRLIDEYRQYKKVMTDVNNIKILLSDQMGAVSNMLINLGEEIDTNITYDIARENKIISKLLSQNIECKEVLIYEEHNKEYQAVLVVKSSTLNNHVLEEIVSSVLKCKMQICKIDQSAETSYYTVTLKKASRYECVFGLASSNKSGNDTSGDCHSVIRLNHDRYMLALCDGMGSGVEAGRVSALTLGLIESFYKVGFDNDTILESANKLLTITNNDRYSTLDICLINLESETADFIKVGSPFGLIKRENDVEVVSGGALPIGALENVKPFIFKTALSTKDLVIMATDGVTDAFKTEEEFKEFVSKLACVNPQTVAETILNKALELNSMSAKDDMTILVSRIILKN